MSCAYARVVAHIPVSPLPEERVFSFPLAWCFRLGRSWRRNRSFWPGCLGLPGPALERRRSSRRFWSRRRPRSSARRRLFWWPYVLRRLPLPALALAFTAAPAAAQRPAELIGRVVERGGAPVEGARVEIVEATTVVLTDATGGFRFRAISAGHYTLRVVRIGFAERVLDIALDGGSTERLTVELVPAPVALEGLAVVAESARTTGVRLDRSAIVRSGARSAGDAVQSVPGVIVRSTAPGGPQTVSIRGSSPDAVLVLVDGVVLNDPITGEADLSRVTAAAIESITVLTGAQSARYGPRAEAGVVIIETRLEADDRAIRASAGSLGSRTAALEWSGVQPVAWSVGGEWRALDGTYDYTLPGGVASGDRRRENAAVQTLSLWTAAAAGVAGGNLRVRGGFETTERGLPGKGYAPSRLARQTVDRLQTSAAWRRVGALGALHVSVAGVSQQVRLRDPDPPFGLPYDDTAAVRTLDLRAEAERGPGAEASACGSRSGARGLSAGPQGSEPPCAFGDVIGYGAGLELRWQRVDTDLLAAEAPPERLDVGAFAHGRVAARPAGLPLMLGAQMRLDRDPLAGDWRLNRSLMVEAEWRGVRAHVASRSSYSPPTLGDQFFREAVGVEPNPELRAERVPSEIEVGFQVGGVLGEADGAGRPLGAPADRHARRSRVHASLALSLYRGDIRDMIVWAPDYRFIWSPRNVDVNRRGAEVRGELRALGDRLSLSGSYAYARVTYDRGGDDDAVQVIYRPRHTAAATVAWQLQDWRLDAEAHYTGKRYPVAAPVNALPGFWTVAAGVSRNWRMGAWRLITSVRADRLFDRKDSLIFGFPEPGRTVRFQVELRPTPTSVPTRAGSP